MKKIFAFLVVFGILLCGCVTEEACPEERSEVCGVDGITYANSCYAEKAGVAVAHEGACVVAIPETCVDSDGGKNLLEYGTTSKGTSSFTDSCRPDGMGVYEYYCENNVITSENMDCPEGMECNGGLCILSAPKCTDSDGGVEPNLLGAATDTQGTKADTCYSSTTVKEYYCNEEGVAASTLVSCTGGKICKNGACVVPDCYDSDGGFNIYEKGQVIPPAGGTFWDYCSGEYKVREYYCSDSGDAVYTTTDCPSGYYCYSGACVRGELCWETDDGIDEDEYGEVSTRDEEAHDSCYDWNTVNEYYCDDGEIGYRKIDCGSGELCEDGECVDDPCYDSDGGKDKYEQGTVEIGDDEWTDYCIDGDTVKEYYCNWGEKDSESMNCGSGKICDDGECVDEPLLCSDSDGGKDYTEKGEVTYGSDTYEDVCTDLNNLREYYCSGGVVKSEVYDCVGSGGFSGCWQGKCSVTMPI